MLVYLNRVVMSKVLLIISLFLICGCSNPTKKVSVFIANDLANDLEYGIHNFKEFASSNGITCVIIQTKEGANLCIELLEDGNEEADGFELKNKNGTLLLLANNKRGLLYGLQDIQEQYSAQKKWHKIKSKKVDAHYKFRAIKFNLPWYSYRSGEHLSLHYKTCRDLNYWESFLDMMLENKFNALTLWNMHPYMFMVKSEAFPEASPFSDEEMLEWKNFWHSLFKMAKDRGIDTYILNWNIFVSDEFSKAYNVADYSASSGFYGAGETNELIEKYTREIVTQTINEYDDLTGIGISLGERMGGMTSEERKDWIDRTIIAGLKNAKREARLIYRAPLSAGLSSEGSASKATEEITREAIENIDLENEVYIPFKYNWSHAHSSPKVSIVHGGILTDTYWDPEPKNYKGLWTMRNEDFFVLRWAQPDFIRSFMANNSQHYIGGCIIGSETYIPAKDYFTKPEYRTWDYAFERQWLFYKVWGNLLYNDQTTDNYFANAISEKFNIENADELLEAWKFASMNANRFACFHQGTWDATIYTEGFTTIGGKFIDINKFISQPVLDSSYVNITDFVQGNYTEDQITPLELAEVTENESKQAAQIAQKYSKKYAGNQDLQIELNDIEAWSHYGLYFASKIRAGVALQRYRQQSNQIDKEEAIKYLQNALTHWKNLVESVEKYNVEVFPYQFDQNFSWRKHIKDVENDIVIATKSVGKKDIK